MWLGLLRSWVNLAVEVGEFRLSATIDVLVLDSYGLYAYEIMNKCLLYSVPYFEKRSYSKATKGSCDSS